MMDGKGTPEQLNPNRKSKLKLLILDNRSLAENDPENLLKYEEARFVYNFLGRNQYNEMVNSILDQAE